VAYLTSLVDEARRVYPVDPRRVFVLGLSNGGFMAHRLACERADTIAAIVSIAGAMPQAAERCRPASPVSVLQVHSDADQIVFFEGGRNLLDRGLGQYPGAEATVRRWAGLLGCRGPRVAEPVALDLDEGVAGAETAVMHVGGCPAGLDARLWTVRGGRHVPAFGPTFVDQAWHWLLAHPKVSSAASAAPMVERDYRDPR
jgi:polyhydroxybutyrate depolymerase